jgi:hypothetical protein
VFDHVDTLAAPRLVEYWETDPCWKPPPPKYKKYSKGAALPEKDMDDGGGGGDLGVKIEAKFVVGEYDIVILSAEDATGLDKWLKREGYKIPDGAEPYLRPNVAAGSKFFVAKVLVKKVTFKGGMAMLSPLRFFYDTPDFSLPVRLGMMNSAGTQDLIVHILARGKRYEVANYDNVFIPTNFDVADKTRKSFGSFYAALFDATLKKTPRAVVTEYAWDAAWCDPCPSPALDPSELTVLGADVLPPGGAGFVLTRLHARYTKDALGEDLVFREAKPVAGGRESIGATGRLERGAVPAGSNTFQARYAIRHWWPGAVKCEHPLRGRWGGPWSWLKIDDDAGVAPAKDLAFATRKGVSLPSYLRSDVPELGLVRAPAAPKPPVPGSATPGKPPPPPKRGDTRARPARGAGVGTLAAALSLGLAVALLGGRRRR